MKDARTAHYNYLFTNKNEATHHLKKTKEKAFNKPKITNWK